MKNSSLAPTNAADLGLPSLEMSTTAQKDFLSDFFNRADGELNAFSFKSVSSLMDMEWGGGRRPTVVIRLHRRFCMLRMRVERERLAVGDTLWRV